MGYLSLPFGSGTHCINTTVEYAFILILHIAVVLLSVDYKVALFKDKKTNLSLLYHNFSQIPTRKEDLKSIQKTPSNKND